MKKMIILFFVVVLVVVGLLSLIFRPKTTTSLPPIENRSGPTPIIGHALTPGSIDYSKVFADPTVAQSVQNTLTNATQSAQIDGFTVYYYPTDVGERPNQVYTKSSTAEYILQQQTQDNADLTTFLKAHSGAQELKLYDADHAGAGFNWYVYPTEGMAFLADKQQGYTIQILYFPKTTKALFLQNAASEFHMLQKNPYGGPESFSP